MWLLFCDRSDRSALWAYGRLRARGLPLELVTTDMLGYALGWEHRLSSADVTIRIELADGRTIEGEDRGVLNRVAAVPAGLAAGAAAADREYALQELHAFWLSWLNGLRCPVLNRPTPLGLDGPWLDRTEWLVLAERAGLVTAPYLSSSGADNQFVGRYVLVVERVMVGVAPPEVVAGCRGLAALAGTALLGVEFSSDGAWTFVNATPHPDLSLGVSTA